MLLLLACADKAPTDDTSAPADTDTDTDSDTDTDTDSDTDTDTDSDTDTYTGADATILAPASGQQWFVGTRYDVVVRFERADVAEVTVSGADATCGALVDSVITCSVVPEVAGDVSVQAFAEGAGGIANVWASASVREAVGILPAGDTFPMGAYEVMSEDWFEPVATGGFNLAQTYATGAYTQEAWQGWAADAGLWTMTRPSWSWEDPWGTIHDPDTLAALAAGPEIGWWELPDNPVEDDAWVDEVADVVDQIRVHDARPTQMYFWTSASAESIAAYVPDVDVISPGTYPEHACQPQPWIRWRITSGLEAVALAGYTPEERPVVGTADLYGRPEASCPERVAELAQVRMNPLAMIAAGARGVIYFAWWYAENNLDPAWGESARETATLITGESGLGHAVVHGTALGDQDVTVVSGPTTSEAFTPANSEDIIQYPSIHAAAWSYAGTRFVVAVNYTADVVVADIAGLPTVNPGVEVVGEDRALVSTAGVVQDSFEGWGAHVYRAPIIEE